MIFVSSVVPSTGLYFIHAWCIYVCVLSRPVGFDIAQGQQILSKGDMLGPAELGLLASVGVTQVALAGMLPFFRW